MRGRCVRKWEEWRRRSCDQDVSKQKQTKIMLQDCKAVSEKKAKILNTYLDALGFSFA